MKKYFNVFRTQKIFISHKNEVWLLFALEGDSPTEMS